MIRPARDLEEDLSDEEFASILEPAEEKICDYMKNTVTYDFFAFFLATSFNMDSIWADSSLLLEYGDAKSHMTTLPKYEELDLKKLNDVLIKKYGIKITNEDPIQIEKIQ